jgi:hypothetical protein
MSEMIDRIARAIEAETDKFDSPVHLYVEKEAKARWERANPEGDWYEQPESKDELESYRIIARAAIEAMREPTDAMVSAYDNWDAYSGSCGSWLNTSAYEAMIDAALKED